MTFGGRPGRLARLERKFALPFGALERKPTRQQPGMQNFPLEFNLREAVDVPSGSSMVADIAGRSGPRRLPRSPTTLSVSTNQVNVQNWLNDRLCGLNSDDFLSDSIAIYSMAPGCV